MCLRLSIIFSLVLCSAISFAETISCDTSYSLEDINTIPKHEYTFTDIKTGKTRPGKVLQMNPKLVSKWHSPAGEVKSITVLVHGMNYRTDYMEDIVQVLTNAGSKVLNISLPGYREILDPETGIPHKDIELVAYKWAGMTLGHKIVDRLDSHPERAHTLEYFHTHIMKA